MNFSETAIVDGTLYMLGLCSLLTWSVILLKFGEFGWHRYRNSRLIRDFEPHSHIQALASDNIMTVGTLATPIGRLWSVGSQIYSRAISKPGKNLDHSAAWHELIERSLRQQLQKERAILDSGLGWLASIGTTAPFIGLFGTVWGIMRALKRISAYKATPAWKS